MKSLVLYIAIFLSHSIYAQLFSEVSDAVGMNHRHQGNSFQVFGGGVMVFDFNNDGWEDVFQCGGLFQSKLWMNDKGVFKDVTSNYGLDTLLHRFYDQSALSADIDNDGFVDFIVLNHGRAFGRGDHKAPILLRNINGERFEKIPLDHLLKQGFYSAGTWGDFNNDGYVDLYLTNYLLSMGGNFDKSTLDSTKYDPVCHPNKLLMNLGGSKFKECSVEYGLDDNGCGLAALFTDVDNDGDVDLMLVNDFGTWNNKGNRLFRNDYPKDGFTEISNEIGFNHEMYGMGIGPGDIDGDGRLDYYITNIGSNLMLMNTESGFVDKAHDLDIDLSTVRDNMRGTSWSGLFFDYDFDGDLDLYVAKGHVLSLIPENVFEDPNKLFRNDNGQFVDVSNVSGLDDALSHRGAVVLDFDRDGDLDIISSVLKLPLASFVNLDQKIKVYQNNSNVGNSIQIKLIGLDGVNRDCFGCKAVFVHKDKRTLFEVDNGRGHASQGTRYIYYGLNSDKKLHQLEVSFTNGNSFIYKDLSHKRMYLIFSDGTITSVKRRRK
jgi:enediyne biosynthesis protein E4